MSILAILILEALSEAARERSLDDVRIGLRYVGVRLDDGSIGVSYNFRANTGCDEITFPGQTSLKKRSAADILDWLISGNPINRSVALAVANGLVGNGQAGSLRGDIRRIARIEAGERVCMVGYFETIAKDLDEYCDLVIYDNNQKKNGKYERKLSVEEGLSGCDVALISATSLLNNTMDNLLDAAKNCREIAILGPSTPLVPEAFVDTPVTLLSGIRTQNEEALRVISEGGGMKEFKPFVQKVNIRLK